MPQMKFDSGNNQLLFILQGANMQSTSDQQFTRMFVGQNYMITNVVGLTKTGATSVACLGGIYTGASKAGSIFVAAAQSWLGASAIGKLVNTTLAALLSTDIQTATPYLSLSTGSTAACTMDIYIYGIVLE